jgi:hypothetical protein
MSMIAEKLQPQECAELLVLLDRGIPETGVQGVMSVVKTFKHCLEFPVESFGELAAEHIRQHAWCKESVFIDGL